MYCKPLFNYGMNMAVKLINEAALELMQQFLMKVLKWQRLFHIKYESCQIQCILVHKHVLHKNDIPDFSFL